jgi:hypothetical protein
MTLCVDRCTSVYVHSRDRVQYNNRYAQITTKYYIRTVCLFWLWCVSLSCSLLTLCQFVPETVRILRSMAVTRWPENRARSMTRDEGRLAAWAVFNQDNAILPLLTSRVFGNREDVYYEKLQCFGCVWQI